MSHTIDGENVVTAVLRHFQGCPDTPMNSRALREAFKETLPKGSGISAAFWSLRERGLLMYEPGGAKGFHVLTEAGRLRTEPVTYKATTPKSKESASPEATNTDERKPAADKEEPDAP